MSHRSTTVQGNARGSKKGCFARPCGLGLKRCLIGFGLVMGLSGSGVAASPLAGLIDVCTQELSIPQKVQALRNIGLSEFESNDSIAYAKLLVFVRMHEHAMYASTNEELTRLRNQLRNWLAYYTDERVWEIKEPDSQNLVLSEDKTMAVRVLLGNSSVPQVHCVVTMPYDPPTYRRLRGSDIVMEDHWITWNKNGKALVPGGVTDVQYLKPEPFREVFDLPFDATLKLYIYPPL